MRLKRSRKKQKSGGGGGVQLAASGWCRLRATRPTTSGGGGASTTAVSDTCTAPPVEGPPPEFHKRALDASGSFAARPCLKLTLPQFKNKPPESIATPSLLELEVRRRQAVGRRACPVLYLLRIPGEVTGERCLPRACVCVLDAYNQADFTATVPANLSR